MTIYKYHIAAFFIYEKFGNASFVAKELDKIGVNSMTQDYLRRRKLVRCITRKEAEETRPEIKEWYNAQWNFQRLTKEGIKVSKFLDQNKHLMAKKLLR